MQPILTNKASNEQFTKLNEFFVVVIVIVIMCVCVFVCLFFVVEILHFFRIQIQIQDL